MQTTIIVFTGLPGTGKTTLSVKVAEALGIPLIAKDAIKEIMYDTIGWGSKEFSGKLARATLAIMEYVAEQQLKTNNPFVLESNYSPKLASQKFQDWQKQYDCRIVQVVCRTDVEVLSVRYGDRVARGDRHPGHLDTGTVDTYRTDFLRRIDNGEDQPLELDGPVRIIDTSDFKTVDAEEIVAWIQNAS